MKLLPYTPLTGWQIALLRELLPHMTAWLATREGSVGVSPAVERSTGK